jgi:hypothetical protein
MTMRLQYFTCLLIVSLIVSTASLVSARGKPEACARDIFLSTRLDKAVGDALVKDIKRLLEKREKSPATRRRKMGKIGLGYTLYMRDADGRAVRVDPSQEFHTGDGIRLMLEPNINGYLYIFNTENGKNPQMIFPNAEMQGGNNAVQAHVPYEVPSSQDPNPDLHWYFFQGERSAERLYVIVARQPLPDIPTGESLVNYHRQNPKDLHWHPTARTWARIKANASAAAVSIKSNTEGQAQSDIERESIDRSLGLHKDAPPPAVIRVSNSSGVNYFVTLIDLIHR